MAGLRSRRSAGVRLFVFDFDQTLTVVHVFKSLAGWVDGNARPAVAGLCPCRVPAPFATSEEGQIRRIEELSETEFKEAGGFSRAAFGGERRVQEVSSLLQGLRAEGSELIICTKGLVGAVKKCLHDLGLLKYFSDVYGNVGVNYGMTSYDKEAAEARPLSEASRQFLGRSEQANWGSKDKLIAVLMKGRGLKRCQCVLVEDDPEEVRRAEPLCRTLLVRDAAGVTQEDIKQLLRMASEPLRQAGPVEARGRGFCTVQ